nr:tyrosine-type recombinase/integrase [uncultured Desulfobacter sp.]
MNHDLIARPENEKSLLKVLKEVPEELLWKANFNSDNSIETYDQAIRSFLSFIGVGAPEELRQVEHGHVIAFKKYLQNSGCSPRTINNRLSAISSLFNHLIDKQVVKINVAQGVRRMPVNADRVEAKVMTPDEVRKMLSAPDTDTLKGIRDKAILATLFYTGCRVSEVCTLKVKDFYQEQGYHVLDFWVKGGKRNRLAIHQELQILINSYLNVACHGMENSSYLFLPVRNAPNCSDPGRKLSRKTVDYLFKRYAKQASLYGVTPHSARATFITQALENNCPIEAVQKTVGHSQIKTTQMYDKRRAKYRESASFAVRY